jgi:3',5'-cyclic AMP phosphodiesterase CpdA
MNLWRPPQLHRRRFLSSLAAAISSPLFASEKTAGFRFIAANDLHYDADPCRPWFTRMVEQMRASAPDAAFCLLCGDLANTGQSQQLLAIREIFAGLQIPIHAVPGNHDHPDADASPENYDAAFPGQRNYRFEHAGWQFLGLDTTMGTGYDKTTIAASTLEWLDTQRLDPAQPTICFTHFPVGGTVPHVPLNAPDLVQRLLRLNLRGVLSGHWHGSSETPAGGALMTTNRCCARVRNNHDRSPLKGWFVCEAGPDGKLNRRFVEYKQSA